MLEQQTLLLRPWAPGPRPEDGPRRRVLDADTVTPLGSVRQGPAAAGWAGWLLPPVLRVHEADDEPLLCTLQRFWYLGTLWEVREADGHLIATVRRRRVDDRGGRRLAVPEAGPDGVVRFRGRSGAVLAEAAVSGGDARLTFAERLAGEPFVKMALLAAALVWE
jgi:hypothetical protein